MANTLSSDRVSPCPSTESLERLLAGPFAEPDARSLREHVAHCAECQAALDCLSDDAELVEWKPADRWAASPLASEPGLVRLLMSLHDSTCEELLGRDTTVDAPDRSLWFLGSPARPGDMGSLAGYRVEAELGRGGMGIVLKAHDSELNRTVALKVLRPDRSDDRSRARFVREAQAAARVKHENVVAVYSVVSSAAAPPFLVMEYIHGPTLRDRIAQQQRLGPREAAEIVLQIADGLAAAHAAGLVHRDIKPGNILLEFKSEFRNTAKISDFGLARITDAASSITHEGTLAGTPTYMSPEQVADPERIDPRSDVYGLGVTMYEALTGEVPFRGAPHMILRQIERDDPRPPRQLNDSVPLDLETICLKAMAKEPGRRYASAREFAADLRRWLAGEPIHARPVGPAERCWRWCRRNPRVAVLSGVVMGLLATLAAGSTIAAARIAKTLEKLEQEREAGVAARVDALAAAAPDAVPFAIEFLKQSPESARGLLRERLQDETAEPTGRLHCATALAALGELHEEVIIESIATIPASAGECTNIVQALGTAAARTRENLRSRADAESDAHQRFRFSSVLLHLGDASAAQKMLAVAEDPSLRTTFIHGFPTWHGELGVLPEILRGTPDSAFRSGLCAALGTLDPRGVSPAQREPIRDVLAELYRTAPDPATHSAAGWALRHWGAKLPEIERSAHEPPARDWFVNRHDVTMLEIAPGTFWMSEPRHHRYVDRTRHRVTITRPYFISDREVWVELFEQFQGDPDYPAAEKPNPATRPLDREVSPTDECPVQNVTWEDAALFCNWLSRREGRTPCYERTATATRTTGTDAQGDSRDVEWADWRCNFDADGYRLPTDAEWEFACRAGTTTRFHFGDDPALLPLYGVSSNNRKTAALPGRSLLPNAWGLFDVHGNVWEWCGDWFAAYSDEHQSDPRGPDKPDATYGPVRVYRGGGVANFSGDPDSPARGYGAPDSVAWNLGFRVVCRARP